MAMTRRNNRKKDGFILYTLNDIVPHDHMVRKLEEAIDWNYIYPLVENLYSDFGRPSIDPVVLFKMLFINITFGINSMRRTCEEIKVNIAYRWFLGLSIEEAIPNYSTWSQNYIRRYGDSEVFDRIFQTILTTAMEYQFIKLESVFGDSTHQKASANKNKYDNKEVELVKKVYEDDLLKEINEDRKAHGKKPVGSTKKREYVFDEETGEQVVKEETKNIKVSKSDPESGCFHKGEKEKCFAYSHQAFCDANGFVVSKTTVPGNIHDSVSFDEAYQKLKSLYGDKICNISLDAGYVTPAICRTIIKDNYTPLMPYKRPMTKKGYFKKYEYVYDEGFDCYLCPNDRVLEYSTTQRNGYKLYKSNPKDCEGCPYIKKCTSSKNKQKIITRHVWEEYKEQATESRYTDLWKEVYPKRKESIERVFGDCKEQHGLRYTRVRGLKKNDHYSTMIFACHNMKKMANWISK